MALAACSLSLRLPARRNNRLLCEAGQRREPSSDPNYRRGSQNDYWRKRTDTGKSVKGASVEGDKR